jgi:hypothetical protein
VHHEQVNAMLLNEFLKEHDKVKGWNRRHAIAEANRSSHDRSPKSERTARHSESVRKIGLLIKEVDQLNKGKFRVPLKVEPHADAYQMLAQITRRKMTHIDTLFS